MSTLKLFKQPHFELWQWLYENPENGESDWPGWQRVTDNSDMPICFCFMCDYYNLLCEGCPLHNVDSGTC